MSVEQDEGTPDPTTIVTPHDENPEETAEWLESFDGLIEEEGTDRAQYIIEQLLHAAHSRHIGVPQPKTTDYVNTIPAGEEPEYPGDIELELGVRRLLRWNTAVMVHRAQRPGLGVGGDLATYASAATLYEVGFNHFFRGKDHPSGGDQVFIQASAAPGMYARAFLEGRLTETDLDGFRQEKSHIIGGSLRGLPAYPHPRNMSWFWEFPTASLGLGPLNAIQQAMFNAYLTNRGLKDTSNQHVWAFLGDGEMSQPESRALIESAARAGLGNLTFVINCNLQQSDGPVRGNGKVIQDLESLFGEAGWNVIKVVWGSGWDELFDADSEGALTALMNSTVDGDFLNCQSRDAAYVRENLFGRDPRTAQMVADWSDDKIWKLTPGGHDYEKVYAAYKSALDAATVPTVILAQTVKGYEAARRFDGRNASNQMKKLVLDDLKIFRDRLHIPISDAVLEVDPYLPPYYKPGQDDPRTVYMLGRRAELGGFVPERRVRTSRLTIPMSGAYEKARKGSERTKISTTAAFVDILNDMMSLREFGRRVVPILADDGRSSGMDAFFSSLKVYNPNGQQYTPCDGGQVHDYPQATDGQILHTGVDEAASVAAFTAAGTSYATHGLPMIPIYVFPAMSGFQRTGDGLWAAADQMTRGFLVGIGSGKTAFVGEGLQHADGHSPLLASTNPAVRHYDPYCAYEITHIMAYGLEMMYGANPRNEIFYLTTYNEPIFQPPEPINADVEGIVKGMYMLKESSMGPASPRVQLMASGVSVPLALEAQGLLASGGIAADVWSVTSWNGLRREAIEAEGGLNGPHREPYITQKLRGHVGPVVALSDFMRSVPDQIAPWVEQPFAALGADGFGFSDTRAAARRWLKVDAASVVVKVLQMMAGTGIVKADAPMDAYRRYHLDDVNATRVIEDSESDE